MFDRIEDKFSAGITGTSEITYDPNGGVMEGASTQKISYNGDDGIEVTLSKAKRTGYILAGWKDDVSGLLYPAGGAYLEKRGMKLTAQWIPDKVDCRIEHYQQGTDGNYLGTPTEYEILKTPTGKAFVPNRKKYEGFITPDASEVIPDANGTTVVKYNYKRRTYQLVYCANGGMFSDENGEEDFIVKQVLCGEKLVYPKLKQRYNYSFEGWTENLSTMPDHDVTIRAIWQKNV